QFSTGNPYQRYSDIDLYLMGLKSASDVKDSYYVLGPSNFSPNFPFQPESSPEAGVSFNGSAIPVSIDDIVAANGVRKPNSASSQKEFTHLFVLITKKDQPATADEVSYLDMVRSVWTGFFQNATGGAGTVDTVLDH